MQPLPLPLSPATVVLTGSRIVVRELVDRDQQGLYALYGHSHDLDRCYQVVRQAHVNASQLPRCIYSLAIAEADDNELIGLVRLALLGHEDAELGLTMRPEFWDQGAAREALTLVLDFAFHSLHLNEVTARHDALDLASAELLTALGFNRDQLVVDVTDHSSATSRRIDQQLSALRWNTLRYR